MQERLLELTVAHEAEQKRIEAEAEQRRLKQLEITMKVQMQREVRAVNFPRETLAPSISVSSKEQELIQILTKINISVSEATSLYEYLKKHKPQISKGTMDYIRNQSRDIMGTIQNPNPISYGLRTVLIDLAFL